MPLETDASHYLHQNNDRDDTNDGDDNDGNNDNKNDGDDAGDDSVDDDNNIKRKDKKYVFLDLNLYFFIRKMKREINDLKKAYQESEYLSGINKTFNDEKKRRESRKSVEYFDEGKEAHSAKNGRSPSRFTMAVLESAPSNRRILKLRYVYFTRFVFFRSGQRPDLLQEEGKKEVKESEMISAFFF
jgi:hypothetical protein